MPVSLSPSLVAGDLCKPGTESEATTFSRLLDAWVVVFLSGGLRVFADRVGAVVSQPDDELHQIMMLKAEPT
jgi:hypothetical protein